MVQIIYQIVTGTPDFTVTINPNVKPDQTHAALGVYSFDNVPDGNYIITITDSVGCIVYLNVTVSENCILEGTILCVTTTSTTTLNNCVLEGDIQCYITTTTTTTFNIEIDSILFNTDSVPTEVYVYSPDTENSTLILSTNLVVPQVDIAHTENKMWLANGFFGNIYEYNITFSPFNITFSKNTGSVHNSTGLCAIDDNTLIVVDGIAVYEANIAPVIPTYVFKFNMLASRTVAGDYMLTITNKFIVTTYTNIDENPTYITQYDYITGNVEVDIDISGEIANPHPYGIYEYDDRIFIANNNEDNTSSIYEIDKDYPYNITLLDTLSYEINGASQVPSLVTVHFNTTTTTTTTEEPTTTTTTTTETPTTTTTTTSA